MDLKRSIVQSSPFIFWHLLWCLQLTVGDKPALVRRQMDIANRCSVSWSSSSSTSLRSSTISSSFRLQIELPSVCRYPSKLENITCVRESLVWRWFKAGYGLKANSQLSPLEYVNNASKHDIDRETGDRWRKKKKKKREREERETSLHDCWRSLLLGARIGDFVANRARPIARYKAARGSLSTPSFSIEALGDSISFMRTGSLREVRFPPFGNSLPISPRILFPP